MDFLEHIPFELLFDSLGVAGVLLLAVVVAQSYALWKVVRWTVSEQTKWQEEEYGRTEKMVAVITRNTEVTTQHTEVFKLITNELVSLLRSLVYSSKKDGQ